METCRKKACVFAPVTDGLQDGRVYFDLPEGMWHIVLLMKTRSGLGDGAKYYCDMLSKESVWWNL